MLKEMKIKVPEEIYLLLKKNTVELAKDLLLKAAIQYYVQDQLSLARAANMCGLSRLEFIDILNSLNIPVFNYSPEDIDEIHEESSKIVERVSQH
jgi:predicted HTH domain antitoxin